MAGFTALRALAVVLATVLAAFLAFLATVRVAAFTVLFARVTARVAVLVAACPAAAVFSAAPVTAATVAVPADFAVDTADCRDARRRAGGLLRRLADRSRALPRALPTASAVRVSASPVVSACSSDIDAPFALYTCRATGTALAVEWLARCEWLARVSEWSDALGSHGEVANCGSYAETCRAY